MESKSVLDSITGVKTGNRRALSKAISRLENGDDELRTALVDRLTEMQQSYILGITGPPGAGKSTLVDAIARAYGAMGKSVAVLAVDPSSPFSGGAVLGDRIRMSRSSGEELIYIRSLATRGALGGLSAAIQDVLLLLQLAAFDCIILETVGVGQAEVDVVKCADTVGLVLVPGMGDGVQALKAGIIEIADTFIINKADYPGADQLQKEIRRVLQLAPEAEYPPKILQTIASTESGIPELLEEFKAHYHWVQQSGAGERRRKAFLHDTFEAELQRQLLAELLADKQVQKKREALEKKVAQRKTSPIQAARELLKQYFAQD